MPAPLLQIEHLSLGFETDDGLLRAVEDLSLRIDTGEIVCLVGESGCGKSITAQSIARLIPSVKHLGGRILLEGVDTCALSGKELRAIRGWLLNNEKRRKTKAGIRRFVNSWLARAQDRGNPRNSSSSPPGYNNNPYRMMTCEGEVV